MTREGSCSGYSWTVAWETKGGDQLSFVITRKNLTGFEPTLNVVEVTDGGVWLRPLRGDMLRLLHDQPQVTNSGYEYTFHRLENFRCYHIFIAVLND